MNFNLWINNVCGLYTNCFANSQRQRENNWIKSVAHLLFYEVWMVVTNCRLYKSFFRKELCKKLYENAQI